MMYSVLVLVYIHKVLVLSEHILSTFSKNLYFNLCCYHKYSTLSARLGHLSCINHIINSLDIACSAILLNTNRKWCVLIEIKADLSRLILLDIYTLPPGS